MVATISAIVITKNEEQRIGACLTSLNWVDEIVVVDSGSTDQTREICKKNSKVVFYEQPWEGFGIQKNRALERASSEWVISIDADEIIPAELAFEIRQTIQNPSYDGYTVKRKNFYRNQWIQHSGWWPDKVLRLFRKDKGRFSDRLVHESVELNGQRGCLTGFIEHHSYNCVSDFIHKTDSYSHLGARVMFEHGKRTSAGKAFVRSIITFVKTYLLKGGILDGTAGILIAVSNAAGVFYRHMKCVELQQDKNVD